jgi:hypothetical protein
MLRLRRFASLIEANAAALYLREHGVEATVVGHLTADVQLAYHRVRNSAGGGYELMLIDPAQRADAELILDSFDTEPVELEAGWEAVAERIDLAQLDPDALAIVCAACSAALPLDDAVEACPACAEPVDILQRLLDTHGPDALADAWIEDTDEE